MPGFMPGIHVFMESRRAKTWMAGTSPAMTKENFIWHTERGETNP